MNKQPKFLVDLKNRVFVSDKPHQDIIDEQGLDPAGYDNYFKGWIYERDAKIWVEQVQDLVFRYWDQAKVGFKHLVDEKLLSSSSRTIAVVDRHDQPAGTVADFLGLSHDVFADKRLGKLTYGDIHPNYKAGARFKLNTMVRIGRDRYLPKNVEGRLLKDVHGHPPVIWVRWSRSVSGTLKPKAAVSYQVDPRVLLPLG
jgi:hypothetical protein